MLMISGLKLQQNGKLEQFYNDDKSEVSEVVKTTLPVVLSFSLIYSWFIEVLFLLGSHAKT